MSSLSPMMRLPTEILDLVMEHLHESKQRERLAPFATISKRFQLAVERLLFRSLHFKFRLIDLQHYHSMATSTHGKHRPGFLREIKIMCYLRAEPPMKVADSYLHPSSTLGSIFDELSSWAEEWNQLRLYKINLDLRAAYLSNLSSRAHAFYPGRPVLDGTQLMTKVDSVVRAYRDAEINIEGDTDCLFDVFLIHMAGKFPKLNRLSLEVLPREPHFGPRQDTLAVKGTQDFAQVLYEMQNKPQTLELVRGARQDLWLCWDFALTGDSGSTYSSGPEIAATLSSSLRMMTSSLRHVSVCDVNISEELFWPSYVSDPLDLPQWPNLEFLDVYTGTLQGIHVSQEFVPREFLNEDRLDRFALAIAKAVSQMPKLRWLTCTWKSGEIPCERPYEGTTFMYRTSRHVNGLSPWRWSWYAEHTKAISAWSGEFGRDDWSETRSGREIENGWHQIEWAIPLEEDTLRWSPPEEAVQLWREKCGETLFEDLVTLERRSTTGAGGGWKRRRNGQRIDFWD